MSRQIGTLITSLAFAGTLAASTLGIHAAGAQPASASRTSAIKIATGSGVIVLPRVKGPMFDITSFGAVSGGPALQNQAAIIAAIDAAAKAGGGTVVIPAGTFKTYSIRL